MYEIAEGIDAGDEDGLSTESSMAKLKATTVAKAAVEGYQVPGN